MAKNKFKALLLAICIALPAMFALTACGGGHQHDYNADWQSDATYHWHACKGEGCTEKTDSAEHTYVAKSDATNHWQGCSVCGYKKDETAHTFVKKTDGTKHWQECSACGYTKDSATHTFVTKDNDEKHWQECTDCGYKKDEIAHAYTTTKYDATNHWKECSCGHKKDEKAHTLTNKDMKTYTHNMGCDCGYMVGEQNHTYEDDSQIDCDVCLHQRDMASLEFKTGTYTFTYDGNTHAFDKTSLVEVEGATIDEVIVKYSTSKDNPVWTTAVPKNAGTYYIQLSVPATNDHTACTINNFEDTSKVLTISQKSISLDDLVLIYKASEMNTKSTTIDLTLTSSDIEGLCGSDTLTVTLHKSNVDDYYPEGTEWNIKDKKSSINVSEDVGIESTTGNYIFNTSTTGKLYIAKEMTQSGEESPYTYTATTAISQNRIVYYSVAVATSSNVKDFEAKNFDVTLSDSDAKIVDIFSKLSLFSVKLTADGTLVAYGRVPEDCLFPFYVVVKYEGSSASKNVTLTLTPNTATTAVTDEEFTNAINLENVNQYHATLKKGDTVIGENKVDRTNKYYKNDNGTEVYYEKYDTSFFKYSKNIANKWARELVSEDESSVFDATKFSSTLLNSLTKNDVRFSSGEQMYKLDSKKIDDVTYTNIALKFEDKKLVYVVYKIDDDTYTIEFEYNDPMITMPSYVGSSSDNPITVNYITNSNKYSSVSTFVTANSTTYYSFNITEKAATNLATTLGKCNLKGEFTADVDGVTFTIKVFNSNDMNEDINKTTNNGELLLSNLEKDDVCIISVTCNKACNISWSLEKNDMTIGS